MGEECTDSVWEQKSFLPITTTLITVVFLSDVLCLVRVKSLLREESLESWNCSCDLYFFLINNTFDITYLDIY